MLVLNHLIRYIKQNNRINHIYNGYYILIAEEEIYLTYVKNNKVWFQLQMYCRDDDYIHIKNIIKYNTQLNISTTSLFSKRFRSFLKIIVVLLNKYFNNFDWEYLDYYSLDITNKERYISSMNSYEYYDDEEFLQINNHCTYGILDN